MENISELMQRREFHTSGADGGNEDRACQLFRLRSWHWEDLVCWQRLAKQHLAAHPKILQKLNSVNQFPFSLINTHF